MELDHDLVVVDEFDALFIELKTPKTEVNQPPSSGPTAADEEALRAKRKRNDAWLRENLGKFPAKAHARKVAKELGVQAGLIYLPGQEEKLYEDSDMGPEFRQRRHFYYLSGADFAGCAVTYDIAHDRLTLWIPYTDPRTVLWYGRTPSLEQCKAASDVDDVRYIAGLGRFLCASLYPGSTLYVLHPDQTPKLEVTKGIVRIDTSKLVSAIERARVVKTDYEIAMIRRANAVSSAAHKAVLTRLNKITNEREMDAIFRGFCLAQGAKHQSYAVIAASGANASTLHYCDNDQPLAGRQLALLDAGAEWNCYASDITRTFPISGKFSPEAAAIYAVVERMQNECIARVRPGTVFSALHLHACVVAITELMKLGILHGGTPSEIFKRGTVAAFFPHGLGHHVGLEVHDVSGRDRLLMSSAPLPSHNGSGWLNRPRRGGKVPAKREWVSPEMLGVMYRNMGSAMPVPVGTGDVYGGDGKQRLAKNMVVTIEPGIYFCYDYVKAYFLDNPAHAKYINTKVLEKYWDVGGVRIEDDILVTETGYENLTTAPKGEEMLKIINAGGGEKCA